MSLTATPSSSRWPVAWLLVWLVVGVVLRTGLARAGQDTFREWEADGFVRAWEPADGNLLRPAGFGWLLALLGHIAGRGAALGLRLACLGVSLLSLMAGWVLVLMMARSTRLAQWSVWKGCAWLTAIWAISPTLVESGVRPIPELALGGTLCLLLAAVSAWGERPSVLRWLALTLALTAALLLGGVVVGVAVVAATLVYLAPVPRLPAALSVLLAVVVAGACAWQAQASANGGRWSPDSAPAWSLVALTEAPLALDASLPIDPPRREAFVLAQALREASELGALRLGALFGRRLVADQIGPARLSGHGGAALSLAVLDAVLRGGALLFAVATLALVRRSQESSLPRAAIATGLLVFGLLAVGCATSPFALAPFDLLVAAVAAVGVAGSRPQGAGTRWLGFGLGGAMMASLVATAALTHQEPSGWSRRLVHETGQGQALVAVLRDAGPSDARGHQLAALLLSDPAAPFQRLPVAARQHAEASVALAPDDSQALLALVRAELENLDFDRARALAGTLLGDDGRLTPQARVALGGIAELERRLRAERLP